MSQKKVNLQRIGNDKTRITTYKKRKACLYKKAEEFSTLCGVQTCLIVYGPTKATDEVVSEPEIWPRDETKVRDIIRKYREKVSNGCRKENHVETFVNDLGKAKDKETNKRVKSTNKYCSWDEKLDKCSREQLSGILYAVDNKLRDAVTRHDRSMSRAHYQAIDTPTPQSLMDPRYMPQYFPEQQQFQGLIFPNNLNYVGYPFIPSHEDQTQMNPNLMESWSDFGLTQGFMMSKGNDGTQLMQRQAQPYYNSEPLVHRSAAYNVNPFAGYNGPSSTPWRFPGNQVEEWELLGKKPI